MRTYEIGNATLWAQSLYERLIFAGALRGTGLDVPEVTIATETSLKSARGDLEGLARSMGYRIEKIEAHADEAAS